MKNVSNEFKLLTKKIKQQDIILTIDEGQLSLRQIHFMSLRAFNTIPISKLKAKKQVVAKQIIYSFDGNLFKTIMQQIEMTIKNAREIKDKDVNFKYGLFVNGNFEYVNMGNYFIKDIEDDKAKEEIVVTGYDRMVRFMKTFRQSNLNLSYPCTILQLVQRMCEVCEVELYSTNFFNANLIIDEDYFTKQELTYRDVLEKICQSTLTTAFIKENKLYFCHLNKSTIQKLDKSYLENLIIKEKFGPVNSLILGRGDVEDNVEAKDDESISTNGKCEIRFDENELVEYKREQVIEEMFEQVKGLEYYSFEGSSKGELWLEPCDFIELSDREDNSYSSIYLKARITINTGITSDIETDIIKETNTEYKVTTKEEKKTLKVERMAKKNAGLIQDLVEETSETSLKLTSVELDVDSISQRVEDIEDLTYTQEGNTMLTLENCIVDGHIVEMHIYGNNTVFNYPIKFGENTFGNSSIFHGNSNIVITDKNGNKKIYDLGIKEVLRQNGEVCDEYVLESGIGKVIRRINQDGTVKVTPTEEIIGETIIMLEEGTNVLSIESYTARIKVVYVQSNEFTDMFATKVQMKSSINQTAEKIELKMEGKLDEKDFNSASIILNINNGVSRSKDKCR